jgi:hypothetical protein
MIDEIFVNSFSGRKKTSAERLISPTPAFQTQVTAFLIPQVVIVF